MENSKNQWDEEYDRLDAQGILNAGEIHQKLNSMGLSSGNIPNNQPPRTVLREKYLRSALNDLKESNIRKGAFFMSDSHPDRQKFAKYKGDREGVASRSDEFYASYKANLVAACTHCVLQNTCILAFDTDKFELDYKKAPARKKLEKALDNNPSAPC